MPRKTIILVLSLLLIFFVFCFKEKGKNTKSAFPILSGPHFGQTPPTDEPEVFAPGVLSTNLYTRDMAITPDGNEIFFSVSALGFNLIFYTKQENELWTEPKVAPFISEYNYMSYEPHITQDGKHFLFLCNKPTDQNSKPNEDIWAVDKINGEWSTPYNIGPPINSENAEFFPSVTKNGTLYFTRNNQGERESFIYRSKFINGKYQEPEKLGPEVNCGTNRYNAFINPDESFIIVPAVGMEDSYGGTDYYIVFRDENDQWSNPINMGERVNTERSGEYSPYISPDGKYFFFMSTRINPENSHFKTNPFITNLVYLFQKPQNGNSDIFWVRTEFIEKLKLKQKE